MISMLRPQSITEDEARSIIDQYAMSPDLGRRLVVGPSDITDSVIAPMEVVMFMTPERLMCVTLKLAHVDDPDEVHWLSMYTQRVPVLTFEITP